MKREETNLGRSPISIIKNATLYNDALVFHDKLNIRPVASISSDLLNDRSKKTILIFDVLLPYFSENIIINSDDTIIYSFDTPNVGNKDVTIDIAKTGKTYSGRLVNITNDKKKDYNRGGGHMTYIEFIDDKTKTYSIIKTEEFIIKQKTMSSKSITIKLLLKGEDLKDNTDGGFDVSIDMYYTIMLYRSPLYDTMMTSISENMDIWHFYHTLHLDNIGNSKKINITENRTITKSSNTLVSSRLDTNVFINGMNLGQDKLDVNKLFLFKRNLRPQRNRIMERGHTKYMVQPSSSNKRTMEEDDESYMGDSVFSPAEIINRKLTLSPSMKLTQFINTILVQLRYMIEYKESDYHMNGQITVPIGRILFTKGTLSSSIIKKKSLLPPIKEGRLIVKDNSMILLDGSNTNINSNTTDISIGEIKTIYITQRLLSSKTVYIEKDEGVSKKVTNNEIIIKNSNTTFQIITVTFENVFSILILDDDEGGGKDLNNEYSFQSSRKKTKGLVVLDIIIAGNSTRSIKYQKNYL